MTKREKDTDSQKSTVILVKVVKLPSKSNPSKVPQQIDLVKLPSKSNPSKVPQENKS